LTDLQLSPAPLTKVDVGFVFAIATAGAHVDVRAQMMAVDSFLLALQVASGMCLGLGSEMWKNALRCSQLFVFFANVHSEQVSGQ
jgi:hypothetical protein